MGRTSPMKFRDAAGRATGLYVPRAHAAEVRRAAAAWKALWETSVAVGELRTTAVFDSSERSMTMEVRATWS